ncbi:MAG TPA: Gfo/Idh/MocA family oxidoreductase [Planctomycetota bacterium]|nr:Gfo/Idh/MocA family oxidoreductase [Planctomycetota bacterium]
MSKRMKKRSYEGKLQGKAKRIAAPALPYLPRNPKKYNPAIGLIGCGGITEKHLAAYRAAGYRVVALCDIDVSRAKERRAQFYPKADVYDEYLDVLEREDIEIVDIATHPHERPPIIGAALSVKKHVLSQKPFVLDLHEGERLCALADKQGVKLAVNQNGRWAPHFSYMRQAIAKGLIGDVNAAHLCVHWDHNWIADTPFNTIKHVVLYDFAIHWFDILTCFMGAREPLRVYASMARTKSQRAHPALLGQALIEYEHAQASLVFDADTQFGQLDETYVTGSAGTLISSGANLTKQRVTLHTKKGVASPTLKGTWFKQGFHGTMAELLSAIEERREPSNHARGNLRSLALCFAAVASAETQAPVAPGSIAKLGE